jgi:hypothetical protein
MEERYVRFGILKGGEEKSFANFKKVKVLYIWTVLAGSKT